MSGELRWPPRKEDLDRLYLAEKLSAAKIAKLYGLKHPNPKSSETLILYHLKQSGITRRDKADHIRKVTEEMVNQWVMRYKDGESLKQIAHGELSPITVWNHLVRRGLKLRDKVDAQIKAVSKYEKRPFSGGNLEKAYLMGLRYGDLNVVRHGRAIRVRVSTTHPAMADLFQSLFSPFGHVSRYARRAKLVGYEWSLESDLHDSFEFLLHKPRLDVMGEFSKGEFIAFAAGVFDAEGTVILHKKRNRHNPEACISNSEAELLDFLSRRLRSLGYHASVRWMNQKFDRGGVVGPSRMGRLGVSRFLEAQRFLQALPIRHAEKIAKRGLVLGLEIGMSNLQGNEIARKWKLLSTDIRSQTEGYVRSAKEWIGREKPRKRSHLSRHDVSDHELGVFGRF